MQKNPTLLPVAACALIDDDRRLILQRRPDGAEHGGLWEFPGGKIEPGETAAGALARELAEELAIAVNPAALSPVGFADRDVGVRNLILLLYACTGWNGEPHACEPGAAIGRFALSDIARLALAPADRDLLPALVRFLAAP